MLLLIKIIVFKMSLFATKFKANFLSKISIYSNIITSERSVMLSWVIQSEFQFWQKNQYIGI